MRRAENSRASGRGAINIDRSSAVQPWMAVPFFTTVAVLCLRVWVAHGSGISRGDNWFFAAVWAVATVPALLVGWIK